MNLKKWWTIMLIGGLILALSAPSALAWTSRPGAGHHPNFRGAAPHGNAYGFHGQRPPSSRGHAYGYHHGQWNNRNAHRGHHPGFYGNQHRYGQSHNPYFGRHAGYQHPYSSAAYHYGAPR